MAFPDNCTPRFIKVDDSCGCALTRADIIAMDKTSFEDQGFKEVGMDRVISQTRAALVAGVRQRSLTDLLLSKFTPIKTTTPIQNQSVIAPFILVPQKNIINANYWLIDAGIVDPNAGVGTVHPGSWILTMVNDQSQFASPLTQIQGYFLPGRSVKALYKDAVTGVGRTVSLKITASVNANAGGVEKAAVTVEPPFTNAGWAALSADEKAIYHPTHGLVMNLSNSVSNFESWCHQDPAVNPMKLLEFWLQTIRETHCYNDQYLAALNAPQTSQYFKNFRQLPIAEQRRQQTMQAEWAFYNTVFFGDQINEKQTGATYQQLPQVLDPNDPTCLLEYKSNTLGFHTQLGRCGRNVDFAGGRLDLDLIKSTAYSLKRNRETSSGEIVRIEAMTDRFTANNLLVTMIDYYKKSYQMDTTRFYTPKQSVTFEKAVLWNYNVYEFPDEGVELAVMHEPFFDDHLAAMPTPDKSKGRYFMMLDWSDLSIGLAKTAAVTRQTNVLDNLYNCVITPNVNHYALSSKTIAAMVPRPNRHAIFENFSDACPKITFQGCTASES